MRTHVNFKLFLHNKWRSKKDPNIKKEVIHVKTNETNHAMS